MVGEPLVDVGLVGSADDAVFYVAGVEFFEGEGTGAFVFGMGVDVNHERGLSYRGCLVGEIDDVEEKTVGYGPRGKDEGKESANLGFS